MFIKFVTKYFIGFLRSFLFRSPKRIKEVCDRNVDRVSKNDKSCHIFSKRLKNYQYSDDGRKKKVSTKSDVW